MSPEGDDALNAMFRLGNHPLLILMHCQWNSLFGMTARS